MSKCRSEVDRVHHDYYLYDRARLLEGSRIPMTVVEERADVFRAIAREMADFIKEQNERGSRTVFIIPVGPIGQYPLFVDIVNSEEISLAKCWFINMDEYLGDDMKWIDTAHPLSFRGFMERSVYSRIRPELNVPEDHRVFPDPDDADRIPKLIDELGGVDICFGGIGINGHLAFNEADASMSCDEFKRLRTRVIKIAPETRAANAIGDFGGRLEDMPEWAVTVGFSEIYGARRIRLAVFRDWHRAVVRRCAHGETTAAFPVSMIADHPDALIRMSGYVADLEG